MGRGAAALSVVPVKQGLFSLGKLASLVGTAPSIWMDVLHLTGCCGNGSVLLELEQRAALPLIPTGRVNTVREGPEEATEMIRGWDRLKELGLFRRREGSGEVLSWPVST